MLQEIRRSPVCRGVSFQDTDEHYQVLHHGHVLDLMRLTLLLAPVLHCKVSFCRFACSMLDGIPAK
jgi:hypothetical protein